MTPREPGEDDRHVIRPGVRRIFDAGLTDPASVQAEMDEEIRLHLEARAADLQALGYSTEQAAAEAHRRFGAIEKAREVLHVSAVERTERLRWLDALDSLRSDAWYSIRGLLARPAFSIGVIATLALGLGVNSAVFRLVDRLFFWSPPGVHQAAALRQLVAVRPGAGAFAERHLYSYPELTTIRNAHAFASVGSYTFARSQLVDGNATLFSSTIGDGYVETLGLQPALGRFFTADELRPLAHIDVAVISASLWHTRFAGDSSVLGRQLQVGDHAFRVVGVMPKDFTGVDLDPVDIWIPVGAGTFGGYTVDGVEIPWNQAPGLLSLEIVARARPGVTDAAAMQLLARARAEDNIGMRDPITLRSLVANRTSGVGVYADNVKVLERVALVAMLILILATANATNLVLARGLQRRQEIGVRLALGISRPRLIRQLLVEAIVLSTISAVIAILTSSWIGSTLRLALFPDARWSSHAADPRVILTTVGISLAIALLVGVIPALQVTNPDLVATLKGASALPGRRTGYVRDSLVIIQVALSVALLIGTGLFVRSLREIAATSVGVEPVNLITVGAPQRPMIGEPPHQDIAAGNDAQSVEDWLTLIRAIPGVHQLTPASVQPFGASDAVSIDIPGRDSIPNPDGFSPLLNGVTPAYFTTMGMHLLAGRLLTDGDNSGSPRVVVINDRMARTYWPGVDPLRQCLRIGGSSRPCSQVVGIVADIREQPKSPGVLRYYVPMSQTPIARPYGAAIVRTAPGASTAVAAAIRKIALGGMLTRDVITVETRFASGIRPWRLGSMLFGGLGALALLLAGVGLSSVLLCVFAERAREIGVRMALGANGEMIARLVVRTGLRLLFIGWLIGAVVGLVTSRALSSMVVGISIADPWVYASMSAALLIAGLIATSLPAIRARRLDPADVLRDR